MKDIPQHVAIIMDGNRRWARQRGLPSLLGHRQGVKSIENVLKAAQESGVKILTLYAFSTENWKRPKKEVDVLMGLLEEYIDKECQRLMNNNIRLTTIGKIDKFPPRLYNKIEKVKKLTENNSGLILNLALNYGARSEIIEAVCRIAEEVKNEKLESADISEELFSKYLYTAGLPDPDLLIRTSGELRLSNFLLWQVSYSEIYITKKYWPDFTKSEFKKAIDAYRRRSRRLGE